jgi:hypothetical protein
MIDKYARSIFNVLKEGFTIGVLSKVHKTYVGHDQSCDILGMIKEKSKFNDNYYHVLMDLDQDNISQAGVNIFNLSKLLSFDINIYKNMLLDCVTYSGISLLSALSYDNLSKNIFATGIAGGVINTVMQNYMTGHIDSTDFLYGMLASVIGIESIRDNNEVEIEDDFYPELDFF